MNIQINLELTGLQFQDGTPIEAITVDPINMNLSPFYAMEKDVAKVFMDEYMPYMDKLQELIFESSIRADDLFSANVIRAFNLNAQEAFRIKRNYVLCKAIYEFGKVFHRDFIKSTSKSKFLADIKVSLEIEKDMSILSSILMDAKSCIEDFEALAITSTFSSFVKGERNPCNRTSNREWYPAQGGNRPRISMATASWSSMCRKYKIGDANGYL